jgi:hypothetical protein
VAVPRAGVLPVRGLHVLGASHNDVELYERFIREVLPAEGVNVLVWEIGYDYAFESYPQVGNPEGVTKEDVKRVLKACREAGVELIPELNCLGHQSWHQHKGALLRAFPEFDETPWLPDDSRDLYCRSYCPLHPDVHKVVFALMDELAEACEAKAFHVGMDEVFLIATDKCPRCGGKDPAEVFAGEVRALHDHLAEKGRTTWMWGDRFLDAAATKLGAYEASANHTHPAVDLVPKDVVVCDWHYDAAPPTPAFFVGKGLRVIACPWRNSDVALAQLDMMRKLRLTDERALGMLQTTWESFGQFASGYFGQASGRQARPEQCFRRLFAAMRQDGGG